MTDGDKSLLSDQLIYTITITMTLFLRKLLESSVNCHIQRVVSRAHLLYSSRMFRLTCITSSMCCMCNPSKLDDKHVYEQQREADERKVTCTCF